MMPRRAGLLVVLAGVAGVAWLLWRSRQGSSPPPNPSLPGPSPYDPPPLWFP